MIDFQALKEQLKTLGHDLPDEQIMSILNEMNIEFDGKGNQPTTTFEHDENTEYDDYRCDVHPHHQSHVSSEYDEAHDTSNIGHGRDFSDGTQDFDADDSYQYDQDARQAHLHGEEYYDGMHDQESEEQPSFYEDVYNTAAQTKRLRADTSILGSIRQPALRPHSAAPSTTANHLRQPSRMGRQVPEHAWEREFAEEEQSDLIRDQRSAQRRIPSRPSSASASQPGSAHRGYRTLYDDEVAEELRDRSGSRSRPQAWADTLGDTDLHRRTSVCGASVVSRTTTASFISRASTTSSSKPGSVKKIDRVARYKELQAGWSKDKFLKGTPTAGGKPKSSVNFHNAFSSMHAAEDEARSKMLKETRARTQRELQVGKEYVAPTSKRRDDLRWQVRCRLAQVE